MPRAAWRSLNLPGRSTGGSRAQRNRYNRAWWRMHSQPGSELRKRHAERERRRLAAPAARRKALKACRRWREKNLDAHRAYARRYHARFRGKDFGGKHNRCFGCGARGKCGRGALKLIDRAKLIRGQLHPVAVWVCRRCR